MPSTEEAVPDPRGISAKPVHDTLAKADKLDVSYRSVETVPVLPMESIAVVLTKSGGNRSGRSQHLSGPSANRASVMPPKPRPKIRLAKNNNPAKTTPDSKTCPQPDGLSSILMSFTGPPRCG